MKNPNGYGCIKHLSGSRRNPWAFVVTENGKQWDFIPRLLSCSGSQVTWNYTDHSDNVANIDSFLLITGY